MDRKEEIGRICEELGFPQEGTRAMLDAYERVMGTPEAGNAFEKWIGAYERDVHLDYGAALLEADEAAKKAGIHRYTAELLLFLCFAIRGFVTAARAKSDVSSFVAVGLTSVIVLQAFIIVGGVTRLIPLSGITLPFISQGGSSLLASFIIVGLLLRCGDEGTGVGQEMTSATSSLHAN